MKYKYFLALYCLIFIFKMSSTVLKYNCIGFDVLRIYRTLAFQDGLRKINLFSSVLMFWQPNGYYNACITKVDQAYQHGYKTKALHVLPKVLSNRLDSTMSFLMPNKLFKHTDDSLCITVICCQKLFSYPATKT